MATAPGQGRTREVEYASFDRTEDYLKPLLAGYRLVAGEYVGIEPVAGCLPSQISGVHVERGHEQLLLFDPATGRRLPTRLEAREAAECGVEEVDRRAKPRNSVSRSSPTRMNVCDRRSGP